MKAVFVLLSCLMASTLCAPKNDLTCSICVDVVTDLDNFITSDTTEQQIIDFVEQVSFYSFILTFQFFNLVIHRFVLLWVPSCLTLQLPAMLWWNLSSLPSLMGLSMITSTHRKSVILLELAHRFLFLKPLKYISLLFNSSFPFL